MPSIEDIESRLILKDDGCLEWPGAKIRGYGCSRCPGHSTKLVHRILWEHHKGLVPTGYELDHLCRNRACANLNHLELVTPKENHRRGLKGVLLTRCPHGHEYTPENTWINGAGRRECKACKRERQRQQRAAKDAAAGISRKPLPGLRTHCPNGHAYEGDNVGRVSKTGERYCRECGRERARQQYYAKLEQNRERAREYQRRKKAN